MKRLILAFVTLAVALAGAEITGAQTWPRDVTGVPSAQCSFLDATGNPVLCDPTHPMPYAGANILNGAQTFGYNWFNSNPPTFTPFVALDGGLTQQTLGGSAKCDFLDDINMVCVSITTPALSISTFHSQDAGRFFSATARAPVNTSFVPNISLITGFARASSTSQCYVALVANPDPNEFVLTCDFLRWNIQTVPPAANFAGGTGEVVLGPSGTLLATGAAAGNLGTVCRSTTQGTSWTCTQPAQFPRPTNPPARGQLTSPTANTWLAISLTSSSGTGCASGCIARSTDDGVTWTVVFTFTAIFNGATVTGQINCLTAQVCIATDPGTGTLSSNPGRIWRSTDGGATWALVQTLGITNAQMIGIVPYPDGKTANIILVNAVGSSAAAPTTTETYLHTVDAGATWQPNTVTAPSPACPGYGTVQGGLSFLVTRAGRAAVGSVFGPCAWYAPLGAGGTVLVGPNGVPWNIGNDGSAPVTLQPIPNPSTQTGFPVASAASQVGTLFNSRTQSGSNAPMTVTIPGAPGTRVHIYRLDVECGLAGGVLLVFNIQDGATRIWGYDNVTTAGSEVFTGPANTTRFGYQWSPALTMTTGNAANINVGACGIATVSELWVQADRY